MTALRIEIMRNLYNGKWDMRIGDIEGCTEILNSSWTEVIDEIADRMKEIENCGKSLDELFTKEKENVISTKEEHHGIRIKSIEPIEGTPLDYWKKSQEGVIIPTFDDSKSTLCEKDNGKSELTPEDKAKADKYIKETVHDLIKQSMNKDYSITTMEGKDD
jgi:hypothetical protein